MSFFLLTVAVAARAHDLTLSGPDPNANYTPNTPIAYRGNGSWDNGERATIGVQIYLVWQDPDNPGGGLTVTEQDTPRIFFAVNPDTGNQIGTYRISNGLDANNNSSLVARQDSGGHSSTYLIQGAPYNKLGYYYDGDTAYVVYLPMGTIM